MYETLIAAALAARRFAYVPYSRFAVGAALQTKDGRIYTGCNVENAAFTPGNCAERTAVFKAVSEGCKDFEAIAVVGTSEDRKGSDICPPCGVCRQVLAEFCEGDFKIVCASVAEDGKAEDVKVYTLAELLPEAFGPKYLK